MIKYIYKFSIIVSIYNIEEYIEEAIDSVIEQSLDFKDNVQLILVNDGSLDSSAEICEKYVNKYPDNIEYYEKTNGGPSSARNYGLNFVRGKYINFLDGDDILSKNALSSVLDFFEKNDKINMAGLVVEYFGAKTGVHPRYEKFGKETTVVDLDDSPQNYILSSAATFYKTEIFDDIRFDANLKIAEDLYANCQVYFKNRHFGIIGHDEAVYHYRIKKKENVFAEKKKYDILEFIYSTEYLYENFMKTLKEKDMQMPEFLKYILLGEIIKRNKVLNVEKKDDNVETFHKLCAKILSNIEDKYIANFYDTDHMIKIALFTLKYGWNERDIEYKIQDNKLYANSLKIGKVNKCNMVLCKYELEEKTLTLTGVYKDILPINVSDSLRFKNSKGKTYITNLKITDNKFYIKKILGLEFNNPYKFEIAIPIDIETKYSPILKVAGLEIPIEFVSTQKNFEIEEYINSEENFKIYNNKKEITLTNENIIIENKSIIKRVKYEIDRIKYIKRVFNVNWIYRIFAKTKKKYILFNDRPMVGGDNSQALFEYVCKNQKKFARNSYFVISKESKFLKELKKIGKVIKKDSLRHKIMFINAKYIISSHANFYNPFNEQETQCFKDLFSYKLIFLQHGVIINDVHLPINKCKSGIDLFVTSTKKEYEEVKTSKYMYNDEVILTGLPRFDKLKDKRQNLILVAPTWRTFLSGKINQEGFHEIQEGFEKSEYYKRFSKLLTNEKLITKLREEKYKIIFLLHPGFRLYEDFFKKLENDIVKIKNVEDIKYVDMFAKLSLLITDYSSIIFDAAYLKKPMLFYQFDSKEYFSKHYKPGYFSYKNDGFGKIIKKESDLVNEIIINIDNGFKLDSLYLERIENTFYKIDKNNSERVFNKIQEILN